MAPLGRDTRVSGTLSGLRVIESSRGAAAAYAGRLLAVCGAEVIMVEPPGGTPLRRVPPFVGEDSSVSALFAYLAAGKSSAVCDLMEADGRGRLDGLLRDADVLIDDTPVDERLRVALDPERIARDFPNLVFTSILPFGAFGPRAHWRATELCNLHAGGEGYLMPNGLANELFPGRPPVKIYGEFASYQGGTSAAIASIAALLARSSAGGQFVDVSIQDANVLEGTIAIQRWNDGVLETRPTRAFRYGGVLECRDGYVEVLTLEAHQWRALVQLAGDTGWAASGEYDDPLERGRRGAEINQHLRAWAKDRFVEEIVRRGRELGVPIAAYASPLEVLNDAHERERGAFVQIPIGNDVAQTLLAAFQFSATPAALAGGPPALDSYSGQTVEASYA